MSSIIETVDVAVPVRTAYDQWTQFEEFPAFMEGVEEIRQTDATHNHWRINIAGVKREFDAEVVEQHPDERIAWRSVGGTGHAGVVTFHRLDDSHTRVTLQLDTAPEGVVENLGDKLGLVSRRAKGDMTRFKEYIESRGAQTGAWRGDVDRPDQRPSPDLQALDDKPPAYGTTAGLAAATAAGTGYLVDADPYTEADTYTATGTAWEPMPESARDLASEGGSTGRHTATSLDTDPFAGIASGTDTGRVGPAVGAGAVTGPYADNPGGAPVDDPADALDDEPDPTADPGYGDLTAPESSSYDVDGIDLTGTDDGAPLVGGESTRPRDPRINPL